MSRISTDLPVISAHAVSSGSQTEPSGGRVQFSDIADSSGECPACSATTALISTPRLMARADADGYLALPTDTINWLIKTGQLPIIRIRGQERLDRRDLDLLIESYKNTSKRRLSSVI